MLKDKNYDLVRTMATKSKGLGQYEVYVKDAEACPHCRELWQQIRNEDERHVGMLADELKRHVQQQDF
ncbi:MAG: hypothetical protein V2A77_04130 [Pseudomonadota bacterium]